MEIGVIDEMVWMIIMITKMSLIPARLQEMTTHHPYSICQYPERPFHLAIDLLEAYIGSLPW